MNKFVIQTTSSEQASQLQQALANPVNGYDVAVSANNTVEVTLSNDADAALELLADLVAAQPQYIGTGLASPLADALKQTAGLLRGRGAQIDAAVDGAVNGAIPASVNDGFRAASNWRPPVDPLVLDLDGDGIETTGLAGHNSVLFDHDGNGVRTATGWIKSDDGLLVLDRNGNGLIDTGAELFGDNTALTNGGTAPNGFAALSQEDTNADGIIDANDTNFANLRVWRDLDQDGISDAGELFTLDELGIASLSLASNAANQNLGNGNRLTSTSSFTRTDGSTGSMGELVLAEERFYREFADAVAISADAAALPDMKGNGAENDAVWEWAA